MWILAPLTKVNSRVWRIALFLLKINHSSASHTTVSRCFWSRLFSCLAIKIIQIIQVIIEVIKIRKVLHIVEVIKIFTFTTTYHVSNCVKVQAWQRIAPACPTQGARGVLGKGDLHFETIQWLLNTREALIISHLSFPSWVIVIVLCLFAEVSSVVAVILRVVFISIVEVIIIFLVMVGTVVVVILVTFFISIQTLLVESFPILK